MATVPHYILTLGVCDSHQFHWPVRSLREIADYFVRVDEDADIAPDGDCPVTGSLSYKKDKTVLLTWMALVDAVSDLNQSRRALAAFLSFPGPGPVTIRIWNMPRSSNDPKQGILRELVVQPTREAVADAVAALEAIPAVKTKR